MPLTLRKADIQVQIFINLDYAAKMRGPNAANAVRLALMLATQLTPEERHAIAETNEFAKTLDFHLDNTKDLLG